MTRTLTVLTGLLALPVTAMGQEAQGLAGTSWRLEALVSFEDAIGTVFPPDPNAYVLDFGGDGRVALRLDCNRGSGTFNETAEGGLSFGPAAMTRALCPEGSLDTRVSRELSFVRGYVLEDYHLSLSLMADGGLMVWTPRP